MLLTADLKTSKPFPCQAKLLITGWISASPRLSLMRKWQQLSQTCPAAVSHGAVCASQGSGSALLGRVWPGSLGNTATSPSLCSAKVGSSRRADAIPLWWMLWNAQNWRHLGDPQVFKKEPNVQRWWGRREPVFPGSMRRNQETIKACWTQRQKGLQREGAVPKYSTLSISSCNCIFLL